MLKTKTLILFILKTQAVPVIFSLIVTLLSQPSSLSVFAGMMWKLTLLFTIPFTIGSLTVYFSKKTSAKSIPYIIFMPWIPVVITILAIMYFSDEEERFLLSFGLLFAMVFSSLGGIFGAYIKKEGSTIKKPLL